MKVRDISNFLVASHSQTQLW